MATELIEITGDGRLRLNFHPGQLRAWDSRKRFVSILSGTQGGKTSFGPVWLWREMQMRGSGDYIVVTPTFPLLELKALPEFRKLFEYTLKLGHYFSAPHRRFEFTEEGSQRLFGATWDGKPSRVIFGYAADPESLESATAKGAWLDEAGQKRFKLGSWEAILRRLSLAMGRVLISTTPYDLGWLKQKIWDQRNTNPDIDVIRFDSTENPIFPKEEFERARRDLPKWKFDLFYRAIFTRPAGLIYDSFLDEHKVKRFALDPKWPRYMGIDFGGLNTAALFYAKEPSSGRYYLYREYKAGGKSAAEHCRDLMKGEPMIPYAVGGSKSEDQWRREFRAGGKVEDKFVSGISINAPLISEVEVGIDRVYGAHKRGQILVFDDLEGYLEEKLTYSRKLDKTDEPTEEIEDKNTFHFMDAERYIMGYLMRGLSRQMTTL